MFLFSKKKKQLNALELAVLNSIAKNIPTQFRNKFDSQIASIDICRRCTQDKEVICSTGRKKDVDAPELKISTKFAEILLGSVIFMVPGSKERFVVKVWLLNGFLFSLTFNMSPLKYQKVSDIELVSVKVNAGVLGEEDCQNEKSSSVAVMPDWLKDLSKSYEVSELKPALNDEAIRKGQERIDLKLPKDLISLYRNVNGFRIENWTILSLNDIRDVVLDMGNYHIIAEDDDGSFLLIEDDEMPDKYYEFYHEDIAPISSDVSLRAILEKILERGNND